MPRAISYFIFSSNGSYLRWDDDTTIDFRIRQYEMSITGGGGVDRLYAGAGTKVDAGALFASANTDELYLSGNFSDYTQTISAGGVYTFTGVTGGSHANEVVSFSMNSNGDKLVFANGHVTVKSSDYLSVSGSYSSILAGSLTLVDQTDPALGAQPGNKPAKVFVFDAGGINIPQLPIVNEAINVSGGGGVDKFYVRKGTNADAIGLFASAGQDVLYLTGAFSDYSQTVSTGGVYTFTRNFTDAADARLTEVVSFSMNSSGDQLVFADGGVTLRLADYLIGTSYALIQARQISSSPTTPGLLPSLRLLSDTGFSSTDNLTNNPTIKVISLYSGATWNYQVDNGSWMAGGTGTSFTASSGSHTYHVQRIDVGVTETALSTVIYTLDTTVPITPILSLASDTGTSASDGLTTNPTIRVDGLENGGRWQYQVNGGSWLNGTGSHFFAQLGSHSYVVQQTDAAGNTSALSEVASYSIIGLSLVSDTGLNASDNLTNNATIQVFGLTSAASWQYQVDTGSWQTGTGSSFTASEGTHRYAVQQTGAVASGASTAVTFTLDTTLPSAPILSLASDTGTHASDGLTNNPIILISALESLAVWAYQVDGMAGAWINGTGSSFSAISGIHTYFVRQTDAAGNSSPWNTALYTLDTTLPGVSNVALTAATGQMNKVLNTGSVVTATVTMNEVVIVTGTPQLALNIGGTTLAAVYASGTGTNTLTFIYTILSGQIDSNGISIDANALNLNNSTIQDTAGNSAALSFSAVPNNANYLVDTLGVRLANIVAGSGGFAINGPVGDASGTSIASVGDINADGFADFIISAPSANDGAGRSYVVFGKTNTSNINLSSIALGSGGFVLNGQNIGDMSGTSVAAVGDINADGFIDLLIGAPAANSRAGRSYVVFGRAHWSGVSTVDLSAIAQGSGGFVVNGEQASQRSGAALSAAGDINGDGYADFVISAPATNNDAGLTGTGLIYVVFGKANWNGSAVNLSTISAGTGGFVIVGQATNEQSGTRVATLGDINGDGWSDLLIGAPGANGGAGRSYVVFGKTNTFAVNLNLVASGGGGFVITGQEVGDQSGTDVAVLGDVNGDGLSDFLIGAPAANGGAGRSYVVFGKANTSAIDLNLVASGSGGFVINGNSNDASGSRVAALGDFNGDGLADFLIGTGNNDSGFVVFGKTDTRALALNSLGKQDGFSIRSAVTGDLSSLSVTAGGDINGDGYADVLIGARAANAGAGQSYVIFGGARFITSALVQARGAVTGSSADEALVGSSEADTLTGGGGVDRFFGGAGDDVFVLTASDTANLSTTTVSNGVLATVDGGSGLDTIRLTGSANLNLTTIANIATGTPSINSRINSIERIDLASDSTTNTLTLSVSDVTDIASINNFNTSNGWVNVSGNALGVSVPKHQLLVDGAATDTLISHGWTLTTNIVSHNGTTYRVLNSYNNSAQLLVANGIVMQPLVSSVAVNAAPSGSFLSGAVVTAVVTVNEAVVVTGTPQLTLRIGGVNALANYVAATSTNTTLVFTYVIQTGQFDANGISINAYSLSLPTGARVFSASTGLDLALSNTAVEDNIKTTVDTAQLRLVNVASGNGGFAITGQAASDLSGFSLSGAGDVNGDGFADVLVGALGANGGVGKSYVVFGKTNSSAVNLSTVANGTGGFVITGQTAGDQSGFSLSGAGDVNGDGLTDVLISAPYATVGTNAYAGKSYVVFGKTNTSAVSLSTVANGTGGFVITGQTAGDLIGYIVSAAGDVNGDGLNDVLISAPYVNNATGKSYVVFGKTDTSAVNLSAVANGTGGFVITGQAVGDQSGFSVSGVGDVNGDGLADVLVGAPYAAGYAGKSYVVFGKTGGARVDLSAVANGSGGFGIIWNNTYELSGWSVAGVGDINGDGMNDLLVSIPDATNFTGKALVVFGKANNANVDLNAVAAGSGGFVINQAANINNSAPTVSALGDFNGDGLADFLINTRNADSARGLSYVVYGKTNTSALELSAVLLGSGGFVISGEQAFGYSSYSASAAGDINGDGYADILIGAPGISYLAGRSYVILGGASAFNPISALVQGTGAVNGTAASETIIGSASADVLNGGGGVDRFFGGAGNDSIILTASDIANLASTLGNDSVRAMVDGGGGMDTLRLSGGANLNLSVIANLAVGNLNIKSRINSIERIDLASDGLVNTLTLNTNDVLDMAGMNNFNTGNGWTNVGGGSALTTSSPRHQLIIDGTEIDTLLTSGWWLSTSMVSSNISGSTQTYRVYNSNSNWAQLLVDSDIRVLPFVSDIGMLAANNVAGVFRTADVVTAYVVFSEAVSVSGSPQLTLNIGGQMVIANYSQLVANNVSTPSILDTLLFTYVIQSGQSDTDGISITANSLNSNGGSITAAASGTMMSLAHAAVTDNGSTLVDTTLTRLDAIAAGTNGWIINGQVQGEQSGYSVSNAGDVNGDGLSDVLIAAPNASATAGKTYVVFGKLNNAAVNLSAVAAGTGGFVINGQAGVKLGGLGVSAAGDLNADGLADLIVMASSTSATPSVAQPQTSYVIFGKKDGTALELSQVAAGSGGFSIVAQPYMQLWSAGDVNGDGWSDLLVQATIGNLDNTGANASYVVFGRPNLANVDLNAVAAGSGGFKINTAGQGIWAAVGDINGDGFGDLVQGLPQLDLTTPITPAGLMYVVFGKADTSAVSEVNFAIQGENAGDNAGWAIAAAGDVNGDGLADMLVSAPYANNGSGKTYVVFGKRNNITNLNLSAVAAGSGGFVIYGQTDEQLGYRISAAGDINGDGLCDIFIGAPGASRLISGVTGASYVVFGKDNTSAVNLSAVAAGSGGFALNGQAGNDGAGWSLSIAGDVNGDGFADLLLGAPGASLDRGKSYVILGGNAIDGLVQGSGVVTGTAANEALGGSNGPDTFSGGGGIDRFFGGAGDDVFVLTASDTANLSSTTVSNGVLATVDGGSGLDTIRLTGGANLNLTTIANIATGTLSINSRINSIERIDLASDSTMNILTLNASDVIDMTSINSFNTGNGWANISGNALSANVPKHQLLVNGTAQDTVIAQGWTSTTDSVNNGGITYRVLNSYNNNAQLLVANDIKIAPLVNGLVINSNASDVLLSGAVVTAVVTVNEAVVVTGTPQLTLRIGGVDAPANYVSATSTNTTLVFTYVIQTGQFDANGISVSANSLSLPLNARVISANTGLDMALSHIALADNSNAKVDTAQLRLVNVASGNGGFAITGQAALDSSGFSVSGAGDINGDGLADVLIGAPGANGGVGKSYVVFGKTNTLSVDLMAVANGTGGFVITGQTAGDLSGFNVSGIGDVNGDGLADVLVSTPYANSYIGKSYVVFGKANTSSVDLIAVANGTGGFVITGQTAGDWSGFSVSGGGDINGDGLADVLVGAPYANNSAGKGYVVFGKTNSSTVNLNLVASGTGGFAIIGQTGDSSAFSVSGVGDINSDGLADLLISAPNANNAVGKSYLVFGKTNTSSVDLIAVANGTGGFVITGQTAGDWSGFSVSGVGDVNGDGMNDLLISAPNAANYAGKSYLVFGVANGSAVNLSAVAAGSGGFVINQVASLNNSAAVVSALGDFNGDGLADFLINTRNADSARGLSYVVYGKTNTSALELSAVLLGSGGFVISGEQANGYSNASGAGDLNGDGYADILLGAQGIGNFIGKSYVILGGASAFNPISALVQGTGAVNGTAASETIIGSASADVLNGGGGVDRFFGGAGNDSIILTASDIANLASTTGNDSVRAMVDGGGGMDTLRLSGGANLNLSVIANLAVGNLNIRSRINSIERIDLASDGLANTLTLNTSDVLDMAGMNNVNTGNGWTNVSGLALANSVAKHQLVIDGTATDVVNLYGAWVKSQTNGVADRISHIDNGVLHTYNLYNSDYAQLFVDIGMVTHIING